MDLKKRKNLIIAFITSQFSYGLLIWKFHSRNLNNKISQIHERALRFFFENNLSFSELLDLYNSVTVHQKKKKGILQILMKKIYKFKNRINSGIMKYIFELLYPLYIIEDRLVTNTGERT